MFKWFVSIFFLTVFIQTSQAKEIYRCEVNGTATYQATPCKDKATQKIACVNYAVETDFKNSLGDKECLDNGANSGGYGGYSSSYNGSYSSGYSGSSSGSSYSPSSNRAKNQYVSGYTRKDGTYVKPYMRSKK
ncbi:DUF4124 domain-containing protein [Acinetobacter sp. TUM15064]|uniref:DUF4124 domain-containing protein n=1 Tax=Acinetobacter sp. TUM15064 TaxID=2609134 RepID=UPI00124C9217|nr:DUF4124 domain-containing protein [Acinetobacter sp. TUM15064]